MKFFAGMMVSALVILGVGGYFYLKISLHGLDSPLKKVVKDMQKEHLKNIPKAEIKDPAEINIIGKGTDQGVVLSAGKKGDCRVRLESIPSGARVIVDNQISLGNTPVDLSGDCGKASAVTFDLDGHLAVKKTIEFKEGNLGLSVRLHPIKKKETTSSKKGLGDLVPDLIDGN